MLPQICVQQVFPLTTTYMLYTIIIDALPAEYEVEARVLVSRGSTGREEIIKALRERHHRPGGRQKGIELWARPVRR